MPKLNELIGSSKADLDKLAKEQGLKGRSKPDRVGLMIRLADEDVPDSVEETLRAFKSDLYEEAKEKGVSDYASKDKEGLIRALLPDGWVGQTESAGGDATQEYPDVVYKVYWPPYCHDGFGANGMPVFTGEVVGYCTEKDRPGVYTYLRPRGEEPATKLKERLEEVASSEMKSGVLSRVMQEPPAEALVKEPPL